jgi:hypothetical protein
VSNELIIEIEVEHDGEYYYPEIAIEYRYHAEKPARGEMRWGGEIEYRGVRLVNAHEHPAATPAAVDLWGKHTFDQRGVQEQIENQEQWND